VFWPRPTVASAVVRLERRDRPAVDVDPAALWRVVDTSFEQRRKTMRAAVRRLGATDPDEVLARAAVDPSARPETLDLAAFARVVEALPA
jgi:16S rRNA (adenine1518-N6/adenine1519-N6)-dimethyltransferase